ncbi:MAG: hypothetical protein ACLUI3_07580 [Christensenellales bacterium]
MQAVSTAKTPQGVVCTARIPQPPKAGRQQLVALDRVQDPGNVGTILRTADAAGLTARSSAQAARISTAQRR